ncbi:unnamed protein product [Cylindrotheca closterium]|uniref:DNA mismatch repair protein n=1 Tax=Cylindrotheca closterium TaxID=2856 RepID=A0AAD2GDG6_9STRA|nr:unnamed protein product [Cylindrotheca closterium]
MKGKDSNYYKSSRQGKSSQGRDMCIQHLMAANAENNNLFDANAAAAKNPTDLSQQSSQHRQQPQDDEESYGLYGGNRQNIRAQSTSRQRRKFPNSSSASVRSTTSSHHRPQSTASHRRRIRRSSTVSSAAGRSIASSQQQQQQPVVHIICAIGENLARETCVASLDAGTPVSLQVTKQGNGQTYAETLAYLEILKPHEILLNEGRKHSPLARKIVELYSTATAREGQPQEQEQVPQEGTATSENTTTTVVKFIPRVCFDQTKGAEMLRRLARKETYDALLVDEYILLSSAYAALHYTQRTLGVGISKNCLDIIVNSGGKNRMAIDRSSLLQLELLTNAKTGKARDSLISTIDCTKTTVGSRLLRTNLMAPPSRMDTIHARLDLVDTFLQSEDFFYAVLENLQNLPAVDKMLTNVAVVPRNPNLASKSKHKNATINARLASKGIATLVYIKSTLTAIPLLTQVLQEHLEELDNNDHPSGEEDEKNGGVSAITGRSSLLIGLGGGEVSTAPPKRHHLLRAITFALSQPELAHVCDTIAQVFTDSTSYSRNANAMQHQECFALKSSEDGMMDILRKNFLSNVDDIYKKADEYAEVHGFHVAVKYTTLRGYYLSIPADVASTLPDVFIQPTMRGKYIHCTTEEVQSLNTRSQDNVNDLLLMTRDRIQGVLEVARDNYDALASLSDAIALLDLCHSFADKVALCQSAWSRPVLHNDDDSNEREDSATEEDEQSKDSSGIIIRNGRFGIETIDSNASDDAASEIVPNDTYATGKKRFTVISGINGSGKSTYLKQIAIIVLLAHCGSYVPAEYASIPIRNRIFARMGTSDDQENNISSFMLEMKETAFICNNASRGSLVLLDELGRATSNEDGIAIAWAVSEYLIAKKAMTFFVSHYPQICRLDQIYPVVQNHHLAASVVTDSSNSITYTHKVATGPCSVSAEYGVEMANSCGWPMDVVEDAREIELSLRGTVAKDLCFEVGNKGTETSKLKKQLKRLSRDMVETVNSSPSIAALRASLETLKAEAGVSPKARTVSATEGGNRQLERSTESSLHRSESKSSRRM